ncbi:hypothetical protein VPNG_04379 [Cytospora leucostoma]|uniref:Uncharacterized protein n=1 Tax=Cytospora leucostoma TaxID=1230097 RepID=A0A423XC19_9PEZI|nr:hypothetical protein VPNG_04379 [Cytospora leucostoma]
MKPLTATMSSPDTISARSSSGGPPSGLSQLARQRWSANNPPSDPTVSFAGKTVLVTGANTGLGFEAAVKFARLGASRLILAVRTPSKGEEAKARILQATGREDDFITILQVDLAEFESVKAFIRVLEEETDHLDVALLNAGLGNPTYVKSPLGWEMAVQVNVLSTALMAVLLLPLLRVAARPGQTLPHLTFVNSHGHSMAEREWIGEDGSLLQAATSEPGWDAKKSYMMVKLLGISVMLALAEATAPTPGEIAKPQIIVNAVCPDLCKTDLGRNFGLVSKILMVPFQALFARTAEQGSRSLVSATALSPESHGQFWHHDILEPLGNLAQDEKLLQQSWSEILDVISEAQPDLQQILDNI